MLGLEHAAVNSTHARLFKILRYIALPPGWATRTLGRDQAKIRHELAWVVKTCDVTQFCNHGCGGHKGQSAERLQGLNDRCQRPV
jgi:hypothetical protein